MMWKRILGGLLSYTPIARLRPDPNCGETANADYCFSIFRGHLINFAKQGITAFPESILELGCGASQGAGLAWLIAGSRRLHSLDVYRYATSERNLAVFDGLVKRFRSALDSADDPLFSSPILTGGRMRMLLDSNRLDLLREAIRAGGDAPDGAFLVRYTAPDYTRDTLEPDSVDFAFSQVVLQHVDDLAGLFANLHGWLKPGGFMSHWIDFSSLGTSEAWNGHWALSDGMYKLMRGKRLYLTNRLPHSEIVRIMKECDFELVADERQIKPSGIKREQLADRYRSISEEDLTTFASWILARKPLKAPEQIHADDSIAASP
ncbi:MAG: methyltransferase domain-containing protein [bacterium]|nr:methyltransferase domain-containing protein [bacterium]